MVYARFLRIITNSTRFPLRNTQAWTMNDTVSLLKGYLVKGWARKERKHPASERERERDTEERKHPSWPWLWVKRDLNINKNMSPEN